MFGRRALQVDMVKKAKKNAEPESSDITFEQKAVIVTASAERVVKKIGLAAFGFVMADTIRKVMIELVKPR